MSSTQTQILRELQEIKAAIGLTKPKKHSPKDKSRDKWRRYLLKGK